MLQVSHLTKIYKTKGGVSVTALDDVSVRFPETGMVFLLGKSGSGKSTLLNVCGGLDSPTEGEIIVKGRSSKDFSQSDFDSYRNTFVGFIFQEYNILNEFSVEDNIALALELQGKPKDKAAIAALLEEVDLTGYAKRKPNTLSGGQKQRIAIARALVKAPEIIMADEPTGALDSATGKQVLDTLKKLSKTKLVLVVSHDRDFAEQYGDRIIELKDGKILSDVSKTQEETREISDNVTVVGSTVCVKKGSELTERDFDEIKTFLRGVDGDVMIAGGERDIKNFREASRITEDGQKEVFRETDESAVEKKTYAPEDSKFIRSKLPLRHAMKIGVSGLKTKPIRLFFTTVLCTVAFVLFGLFSTMTFYNSEATFKQSLKDSDHKTVQILKTYTARQTYYQNGKKTDEYDFSYDAKFSQADLDGYAAEFGSEAFGAIHANVSFGAQTTSEYWDNEIKYFGLMREDSALREKITGNYPSTDTEILLSSYTASAIFYRKANDAQGNLLELTKPEDIIGKSLDLGGNTYTVSGIFDCGELPAKFDPIRDGEDYKDSLDNELQWALSDGLYKIAFITENKLTVLAKALSIGSPHDYSYRSIVLATEKDGGGNFTYPEASGSYYYTLSQSGSAVHYLTDSTTVGDGQTVVDIAVFFEILRSAISLDQLGADAVWINAQNAYWDWYNENSDKHENFPSLIPQWENDYLNEIPHVSDGETDELYEDWLSAYRSYEEGRAGLDKYYALSEAVGTLSSNGIWVYDDAGYSEWVPLTAEQRTTLFNTVFAYLEEREAPLQVGLKLYNNESRATVGNARIFTVVGIANMDATENLYRYNNVYFNDTVFDSLWTEQKSAYEYYSETSTNYAPDENSYYNTVFLPYDHSDKGTESLWDIYKQKGYNENDERVYMTTSMIDQVQTVDELITELSKVFLWVGVVLAAFAALLLSNFISVSISQKKREIGILRAVGARGVDVFKIFFSESFVITLICMLVSLVGTVVLCRVLNGEIAASIGASIFNFGILSFLALLLIAGLTAIVATFLPVWNAARKKPVDSIRAL